MKIYSIYAITNLITNKVYIGYTENFEQRMKQHRENRRKQKSKLYSSIQKHGWENFKCEIIYQSLDANHCKNIMESYFISQYNSYHNGYNMTFGGEGFDSESNSAFAKETWKKSEHLEKMKHLRKEMWQDEEYREKQHLIMVDRWKNKEYREGVIKRTHEYWEDEQIRLEHGQKIKQALDNPKERKRLSDNQKLCWNKPGYRENQKQKQSESWNDPSSGLYKLKGDYLIIDPEGNEHRIKGMKQFCREYNLDSRYMYSVANGKITHYKGWKAIRLD